MKLSACSIAWRKTKTYTGVDNLQRPFPEIIRDLAAWGYDGVELWDPHVEAMDAAAIDQLTAALAAHRLTVPMLSAYYNFTKSAQHAADSLAHGHRVLARARAVGATAIRIFTGNHRSADADAEQWARTVACLQELCDDAATTGITLAAEVHDWNLMDTVDGCERLVDRVARPNFGLIDHPTLFPASPTGLLQRLARHVRHVHATNLDGTLETGRLHWAEIVAALRDHGFTGYLSVEWFGSDADATVQREGAFLRDLIGKI